MSWVGGGGGGGEGRCMNRGVNHTYLLWVVIRGLYVPPFFDDPSQVDWVERNEDLPDLVVLREAVEVVDRERDSLAANLSVRQLQ